MGLGEFKPAKPVSPAPSNRRGASGDYSTALTLTKQATHWRLSNTHHRFGAQCFTKGSPVFSPKTHSSLRPPRPRGRSLPRLEKMRAEPVIEKRLRTLKAAPAQTPAGIYSTLVS